MVVTHVFSRYGEGPARVWRGCPPGVVTRDLGHRSLPRRLSLSALTHFIHIYIIVQKYIAPRGMLFQLETSLVTAFVINKLLGKSFIHVHQVFLHFTQRWGTLEIFIFLQRDIGCNISYVHSNCILSVLYL